MKGLQQQTDSGVVFLTIKHGSLVEERKQPQDGFEPITVKNPRTETESVKFIKRYKAVEALVTKIEWRDTGDQYDQRYQSWRIHLDADGTPCILEIPFQSRASSRFMKLAENIDYSQPVEFRAWHDAKEDKTAFFVGQNGQSVLQKYTRDNPGECPPPVKRGVMGKWNFDDQTEWLHSLMLNVVIPRVDATNAANGAQQPSDASSGENPEYPYDGAPDDETAPF
jgi:hypothetical protein